MAKAKSPSDLVVEYFLGIKYFENDDSLIVKDVEFVGIFSVPRTTKEVLVLQAEDAKGFDN